jgi:hypothetical protein
MPIAETGEPMACDWETPWQFADYAIAKCHGSGVEPKDLSLAARLMRTVSASETHQDLEKHI